MAVHKTAFHEAVSHDGTGIYGLCHGGLDYSDAPPLVMERHNRPADHDHQPVSEARQRHLAGAILVLRPDDAAVPALPCGAVQKGEQGSSDADNAIWIVFCWLIKLVGVFHKRYFSLLLPSRDLRTTKGRSFTSDATYLVRLTFHSTNAIIKICKTYITN